MGSIVPEVESFVVGDSVYVIVPEHSMYGKEFVVTEPDSDEHDVLWVEVTRVSNGDTYQFIQAKVINESLVLKLQPYAQGNKVNHQLI